MLKSRAFTLVEVLITVGIIGVVAAITIPLLIQNSNSKKFATQFKKSLSTLDQAAIGAQAQYDMNYSVLSDASVDATCATDTLAAGQYTLCGLLNNTLSGHTYSGKYGVVKGVNSTDTYVANLSSFSINNFLIFSFADGAFVAFNPNAKDCSVGSGSVISSDMLTSGNLANCLGFIDVNGATPPNKEVKCSESTTALSVNATCKVTNATMGDIFPIVFFNGSVEPSTNASLAVLLGDNGKEQTNDTNPKVNFDSTFTDENGNNIGLKMVKDENGDLKKMGYADAQNACPQGTKLPDIDTLNKILVNNRETSSNPHDFDWGAVDDGGLKLPARTSFWSSTPATDETQQWNWMMTGNTAWAYIAHSSPSWESAVVCIEDK